MKRDWIYALLAWFGLCAIVAVALGWSFLTSGGGPVGGTGIPVFIDSGSTTPYLDSTGTVWSADGDVVGGITATSTTPISNFADPALLQTFRTAPTGNIAYSVPVGGGGLFQVSELEAELTTGFVQGSRVQQIVLACDGTQLVTRNHFDILDPTGPCGGNTAVGRACTVTDWVSCGSTGDSSSHIISITFNAVSNQAQVNAIRIIPNAQAVLTQPTPLPTATPPPTGGLGPQIVSCAGGVATGADVPLTLNVSGGEGLLLIHRGNPNSPADPGVSDSFGDVWTLDTGVMGKSINGPSAGCLNVDYVTAPVNTGSVIITAKSPGTGLVNTAVACEISDFGGLDAANGVVFTPYTTTVSASSITPTLTLDTLLGMYDVEATSPSFTAGSVNSTGPGTPQDVSLLGTPSNASLLVGTPTEQGVLGNTVVIQRGATPAGNFCGGLTALEPVVAFVGRSQGFVPSTGGPVMAANDFLNTIGVNTGITQSDESAAQVQAEVEYLGVRSIRDDNNNCANHTTDVLGNTVSYCAAPQQTLIDYCNEHNGTAHTTVGTPITASGGFANGASNPNGVMLVMLPTANPEGTTECDSNNTCMANNKGIYDLLAQCGVSPASTNSVLMVEGLNEPSNDGHVTYKGQNCDGSTSFAPCAAYMQDLWKFVHGQATSDGTVDTVLPSLGIRLSDMSDIGPEPDNACLQYLTVPSGVTCAGPGVTGTQFADIATLHNYLGNGGSTPFDNNVWIDFGNSLGSGLGSFDPNAQKAFFGNMDGEYCHQTSTQHFPATGYPQCLSIPINTTETGWIGTSNITPTQAGKYALATYLTAPGFNYQHIFWYMSVDSAKGAGVQNFFQTNTQQQPTLKPYPAAIYLHNLTTILSDITSAFTITPVRVATTTLPSTVHTLTMEKSNGTYEYAIWDDRPEGEGTDNVTVTLPSGFTSGNVYDPTLGVAAQSTFTGSSVSLALTDHPMIVEFNVGVPIPGFGPSPTPIPAPSAAPTPSATPIPGAPTLSDVASSVSAAPATSEVVFPNVKPPNGSTLVLIAGENYNPTPQFVVPSGFNQILAPISQTTTIMSCGPSPCANAIQAWCKTAASETGGGYTISWQGSTNGAGYVTGGLFVLQGTSCSKIDGAIATVAQQGASATIPAVRSSSTDIVLSAAVAVGGSQPTNVVVTGFGLDYNQLWDYGYQQTGLDYWLPTNTLGPTVVLTDGPPTNQAGFLGVQLAFHP